LANIHVPSEVTSLIESTGGQKYSRKSLYLLMSHHALAARLGIAG
jgi:hypothetical protein